jgi:hypothetical protein
MAAKNNKQTKCRAPRDNAKGKYIAKRRQSEARRYPSESGSKYQESETCSNLEESVSWEWAGVDQEMQEIEVYERGH